MDEESAQLAGVFASDRAPRKLVCTCTVVTSCSVIGVFVILTSCLALISSSSSLRRRLNDVNCDVIRGFAFMKDRCTIVK